MVIAVVPQSTIAGPEIEPSQLPMAMFNLFIIENDQVKGCSSNTLTMLSETEMGQRGELIYDILTDAEKSMNSGFEATLDIPALKISASNKNCPLVTFAQYEMMKMNDQGYYEYSWFDVRENKYTTMDWSDGVRAINFETSQLDYIDDLVKSFSYEAGYMTDSVPDSVWIRVQIITHDASQDWWTGETDEFMLQINSSGESKVELACSNWPLSIKMGSEMT
jgi:hypothetical protein